MKSVLFAVAFAFIATYDALAARHCDLRTTIVTYLARSFNEVVVHRGIAHNGTVIEVLASPEGATWTILVNHPTGVACVVASGLLWAPAAPVVGTEAALRNHGVAKRS